MKIFKYKDAVKKIVSSVGENYASAGDLHTDLEAYVSHWLMNECEDVPYSSEQDKKIVEAFLAEHGPELKLDYKDVPYPPPKKVSFRFIDLFAGIGGFRQAFQSCGGKCVFSSEWDKYAKKTYQANYGEVPYGDIKKIDKELIPNHDVLCAGFPCQPFSLAGVSKKNSLGRKHGFDDETQGTLFLILKRSLN